MSVAVITCTGGRPELFALCRRWVERQTLRPAIWLVTDDTGGEKLDAPSWATFHRTPKVPDVFMDVPAREAFWALSDAITQIPPVDHVVVMEDDDWYGPHYVAEACSHLRHHHIVQATRYWRCHLPSRKASQGLFSKHDDLLVPGVASWWEHQNLEVMERTRLPMLPPIYFYTSNQVVSIKGAGHGLPGRAGATTKHDPSHFKVRRATDDPDFSVFRALVGKEDAEAYISLLR